MKRLLFKLTVLLSLAFISSVYSAEDEYVKLMGKVTVAKESDNWLKASVPFAPIVHPKLARFQKNRPATIEEALNVEYLDNVKVKLFLCFSNEYKKKLLRNNSLKDAQFYQYYSSEIEYETIKIDRNTKTAHFLFPAAMAERDGFSKGGYVKLVGYAVEISQNGIPFEMKDSIFFDGYREDAILRKFKDQAAANADKNKGILLPAHVIDSSYLEPSSFVKRQAGTAY
jgi:hypothetical protein